MMNNNMIRSIQSHSVSVAVLRTSLLRAQLIDGFKRAFRSSIYWKLYSFFLCVVAVCCWCWCRCCCFVFDVQNHIVRITLVKKRIHCHVVKHTVWSFHSVSQLVSQLARLRRWKWSDKRPKRSKPILKHTLALACSPIRSAHQLYC